MISVLITGYLFLLEPLRLTVEEVPLEMRGWAEEAAPARVVMLSDIHAAERDGWRLDRIVQETEEEAPEAILLAGDYFCDIRKRGRAMKPQKVAEHLSPLAQICPVYFVFGNHDYGARGKELRKAFLSAGFIDIEKKDCELSFANGQKLLLRGEPYISEPARGSRSVAHPGLEKRYSKDKLPADKPLLVLTHSPYYFLHYSLWADLTVAGHTHGGQACWPGGTPLVTYPSWSRDTARAGLKRGLSGGWVYTSRGLGLSRVPVRMFCPPEITVLSLSRSRASSKSRPEARRSAIRR